MNGLPAAVGVDASGSLGLGQVIGNQAGQPFGLNEVFGATAGFVDTTSTGLRTIMKDPMDFGAWREGGLQAAPASVKYMLRLLDATERNNYLDRKGKPILPDGLNAESFAALSIGFTPLQVSKQRAHDFSLMRKEQRYQEKRNTVTHDIARSLFAYQKTGEDQHLQQAKKEMSDFIAENPWQDAKSLSDSVSLSLKQFYTPLNPTPDLLSQTLLAGLQETYPGVVYPTSNSVGSRSAGSSNGFSSVFKLSWKFSGV